MLSPGQPVRAAVVFAHPLPIEGGTMHTKAVYRATKALARIGCAVLRFNFRGVGSSEGTWDEGPGELDDFRAALDVMAARYPDAELWTAGFSFGSWVALTVGALDDRVRVLIGIAPPLDRYDFSVVAKSTKPKFFIQGELDEICPLKRMYEFYCAAAGAEGTGRHRRRQPPVRRQGLGSGRRDRRPSRRLQDAGELMAVARAEARACVLLEGLSMTDAVIVSAVRTAVGKAPAGTLRTTRPDDMAAAVLAEALRRAPGVDAAEIDDVILGCAMPEAEQGLNVARIASLRAGVPVSASAVTVEPILRVRPAGHRVGRRADRARAGGRPSSPAAPSR